GRAQGDARWPARSVPRRGPGRWGGSTHAALPALDERRRGEGTDGDQLLLLPERPARRSADPWQPDLLPAGAAARLRPSPGISCRGDSLDSALRAPELGGDAPRGAKFPATPERLPSARPCMGRERAAGGGAAPSAPAVGQPSRGWTWIGSHDR